MECNPFFISFFAKCIQFHFLEQRFRAGAVAVAVLRDRAWGMATRVRTLTHGLDRGRQIEQRIEHSLAAIHHVLRQRHDVGNGKDMTAGRDARDATVA